MAAATKEIGVETKANIEVNHSVSIKQEIS
jgi:hypothetical protein